MNETVCCLFLLNEESCMCTLNCMHVLNTGDYEFHISPVTTALHQRTLGTDLS